MSAPRRENRNRRTVENGHASLNTFLQLRLKERWQKYKKALKRSRNKFSEKSVHELRIETRRMLALLDLMHPFCPAHCLNVEKRFKRLFKGSASLRDTQVQSRNIKKELKGFPDLARFAKWLRRREKRLACRFVKETRSAVKPKFKSAVKDLRKWCRNWGQGSAPKISDSKILLRRLDAACERLQRLRQAVQPDKPDTIHQVRIAFKAYRYMVELLHPEMLTVSPRNLKQLHTYQAMTGEIQDAEVLLKMLAGFEKAKGKADLNSFRTGLSRRRAEAIRRFLGARLPVTSQNATRRPV